MSEIAGHVSYGVLYPLDGGLKDTRKHYISYLCIPMVCTCVEVKEEFRGCNRLYYSWTEHYGENYFKLVVVYGNAVRNTILSCMVALTASLQLSAALV